MPPNSVKALTVSEILSAYHSARLRTAAQEWKETYNVVNIRKFHALMKQFDKFQVNHVTPTSREQQGISCLRTVIEGELEC